MPRDDFSVQTKRAGAMRVGYRCCFKGCNRITIAKADNQAHFQNDGIACHICAASKNGPRYDPNMTKEERSGLDNLIWMCSNHAHQIDTDKDNYTVEELKKWKEIKEKETYDEYTNGKYYSEKEPDQLEFELNSMLDSCEYERLNLVLSYKLNSSFGNKLDEIILRYKCKLFVVSEAESLAVSFSEYINKKYEKLDEIICFIFERCSEKSINLILDNCDADCPHYQEMIDARANGFLPFITSEKHFLQGQSYLNMLLNYRILYNRSFKFMNSDNKEIEFNTMDLHSEILYKILELEKKIYKNDFNGNELYDEIFNQWDHIKTFRKIEFYSIVEVLLIYLSFVDMKKFESLYLSLDDQAKESVRISRLRIQTDIESKKADINTILSHCDKFNDMSLFIYYLMSLSEQERASLIEERKYLMNKDSRIIYILDKCNSLGSSDINKYCAEYDDLFVNCVKYKHSIDKTQSFGKIIEFKYQLQQIVLEDFVDILAKEKALSEIYEIIENSQLLNTQTQLLFLLTKYFDCDSSLASYVEKQSNKMLSLYPNNYHLLIFKANALFYLKREYEATKTFITAYNLNKNEKLLLNIISLKINQRDFIDDSLIPDCLHLANDFVHYYLAEHYMALNKFDDAKKEFLKCYSLGFEKEIVSKRLFSISLEDTKCEYVTDDVVVSATNGEKTIHFFFLKDYIKGLNYDNKDGVLYASLNDPLFFDFKYKKTNDQVEYCNQKYKIKIIDDIFVFIARQGFLALSKDPSTKVFKADDPAKALEDISSFMIESIKESEKSIKKLMEMPILLPTSFMITHFKNNLRSYLSYFKSNFLFRNNSNILNANFSDCKFIITSESLMFLYMMDFSDLNISDKFYLTKETHNFIYKMCQDNLASIDNPFEKGFLGVENGNLRYLEFGSDYKNGEYKFWNGLKNFISKFNVLEKYDDILFKDKLSDLNKIFETCLIEKSIYNAYKNNEKYIICTDDNFLNNLFAFLNIPNIGVSALVPFLFKKTEYLDIVSKLYSFGFKFFTSFNLLREIFKDDDLLNKVLNNGYDPSRIKINMQQFINFKPK